VQSPDEAAPLHHPPDHRGSHDAAVWLLVADAKLCAEVRAMLDAHGYRHRVIADSDALWETGPPLVPACLLCSHPLPDGLTGFQMLGGIRQRGWLLPTVLMAGDWNVPEVVKAMRAGADNFLTLPLDPAELLEAVGHALGEAQNRWTEASSIADAKNRVATLDKRELQVVKAVMRGLLNKEIADDLHLALITIKVYRGRAMKKLGAGNAAELARIASLAGLDE
jgi:FixJ family two-component response regulator